jgi:hypothetical protein
LFGHFTARLVRRWNLSCTLFGHFTARWVRRWNLSRTLPCVFTAIVVRRWKVSRAVSPLFSVVYSPRAYPVRDHSPDASWSILLYDVTSAVYSRNDTGTRARRPPVESTRRPLYEPWEERWDGRSSLSPSGTAALTRFLQCSISCTVTRADLDSSVVPADLALARTLE